MTVGCLMKMCDVKPGKAVFINIEGTDKKRLRSIASAVVNKIYMSDTTIFVDAEHKEKKK